MIASGDEKIEKLGGDRNLSSFSYTQNASFPGSLAIVKGEPQTVSSEGISTNVYFRQHANVAQNYGEETGKMMAFFTSDYGLAPQANMTLVETDDGAPNGYAAPGIVFLSPSTIGTQVNQRVLADQIARQWWGVLVSPSNRNHLWLTNGGARYSQILYLQHLGGPGAADNDLHNDYVEALTVTDPPMIQASRLEDYSPEFWALTAAKGAAVFNMLRGVVGDQVFFKGVKAFMDQYSFKSATSGELSQGHGTSVWPGSAVFLPAMARVQRRSGVQAVLYGFPDAKGIPRGRAKCRRIWIPSACPSTYASKRKAIRRDKKVEVVGHLERVQRGHVRQAAIHHARSRPPDSAHGQLRCASQSRSGAASSLSKSAISRTH